MSDATKPVAFRVSPEIDQQIQELAKADGMNKSEWVREQVMKAVHAMTPPEEAAPEQPAEPSQSPTSLRQVLEARIQGAEDALRRDIDGVKAAVLEVAKRHQEDLCTMAQVGLTVEESVEQRIEATCVEILDAIERLKQSQRSHRDSVVRVITQARDPSPPRPRRY